MSMLRLVSFHCTKNANIRVGALTSPSTVLDLSQYTHKLKGYLPPPETFTATHGASTDMLRLIESGDETAHWLHQVLAAARENPTAIAPSLVSLAEVSLHAPIPVPRRNLMCVGKNYKDHIAEVAAADALRKTATPSTPSTPPAGPATPAVVPPESKYAQFFSKATTTVVGPGAQVQSHPQVTQWLDYEAELAVVIGKAGRDISRENALSHVFGFSIANDITSRDVQKKHNQWFRGKSLDTTCPLGPCIVHKSSTTAENALLDPQRLDIKLWLNGELRQKSNTSNMIFDIAEIIHQLSAGLTLLPGDVILTGTPSGVGYAMKPPQMLKAGDHCAIEIQHIGRLENTLV